MLRVIEGVVVLCGCCQYAGYTVLCIVSNVSNTNLMLLMDYFLLSRKFTITEKKPPTTANFRAR